MVKDIFSPIAGVRRARALEQWACVYVGAETVLLRYRTPANMRPSPKNGRKIVSYLEKDIFLPIAGVQRARALVRRASVHVGAKTVPTMYCTPAYMGPSPKNCRKIVSYVVKDILSPIAGVRRA